MASKNRTQLATLLKRIAQEPAADWDFKSEREKTTWLIGQFVDTFLAQATMALEKVKPKKPKRKVNRKRSAVPSFPSSR